MSPRAHPGNNNGRHAAGRGDQHADGEHRHNPSGSKAARRLARRRGFNVPKWSARQAARRAEERKARTQRGYRCPDHDWVSPEPGPCAICEKTMAPVPA